jgi:hypothetical protein
MLAHSGTSSKTVVIDGSVSGSCVGGLAKTCFGKGGRVPGDIEQKTRDDIGKLESAHPMMDSLAESAYVLAATLDGDVDDKARAGLHRELRAHLIEIARLGVPDDDGFEKGLSRPTMPPTVRDPATP